MIVKVPIFVEVSRIPHEGLEDVSRILNAHFTFLLKQPEVFKEEVTCYNEGLKNILSTVTGNLKILTREEALETLRLKK
jgi:hypothetical protein